jgi:uncharacterized protein YkwD
MRRLASFVAVLLAIWAYVPAQAATPAAGLPAAGQLTVAEQYLFAAANAERSQRGLPNLRWDPGLYRAADMHAREMAARASISHQYPGEIDLAGRGRQAGVRFSMIAENVAEAPTAVRIHDAWMASEGHRENLLDARADSVGIRVLRRDGELYAVEDFARAVESRTIVEQESEVQSLLQSVSLVTVVPATEETRRTCTMDTGYAGQRKPWFVMRYTTANLSLLPEALKTQLATGKYHQAQVGACTATDRPEFSTFKLAVLLYP